MLDTSTLHTNDTDQNGAALNSTVTAVAVCPVGKVLLGGGGQITMSGTADVTDQAVIIASYPSGPGAWTAIAKATTAWGPGHHIIVTAYIVCTT